MSTVNPASTNVSPANYAESSTYGEKETRQAGSSVPSAASLRLPQTPGAPELPTKEISANDWQILVATMGSEIFDLQMKTELQGMAHTKARRIQAQERVVQKLTESIRAAEKKKKQSIWQKIGNWFKKIGMAIAAAFTVALAVIAAPVLSPAVAAIALTLAITFLANSVVDLASQISKDAGGPSFSLGGALQKAVSKILQGFGVDKDIAEKISNYAAVACPILMIGCPELLGDFVKQAALDSGVSETTAAKIAMIVTITAVIVACVAVAVASGSALSKCTSELAQTLIKLSATGQVAGMAVGGAGTITEGAANTSLAKLNYKIQSSDAMAKFYKKMLDWLMEKVKEETEQIKSITQAEVNLFKSIADGLEQRRDLYKFILDSGVSTA